MPAEEQARAREEAKRAGCHGCLLGLGLWAAAIFVLGQFSAREGGFHTSGEKVLGWSLLLLGLGLLIGGLLASLAGWYTWLSGGVPAPKKPEPPLTIRIEVTIKDEPDGRGRGESR